MQYKKTKQTTNDFSESRYAKRIPVTVTCPYCGHIQKTAFDKEIGENKQRMAITWKCPKCGEYSKLWDWTLHPIEDAAADDL